jgi:hypothetical protein
MLEWYKANEPTRVKIFRKKFGDYAAGKREHPQTKKARASLRNIASGKYEKIYNTHWGYILWVAGRERGDVARFDAIAAQLKALNEGRAAKRAAARQGRTCAGCGKPINAQRSTARFCGPTCRSRAWRADDPAGTQTEGGFGRPFRSFR